MTDPASVQVASDGADPAIEVHQQYHSPIVNPKQRKCRDICCLVFAVLFIIGIVVIYVYYIVVDEYIWEKDDPESFYKLVARSKLYLMPGDRLRRICGTDAQVDELSVDYSEVIKNEGRLDVLKTAFCNMSPGEDWKRKSVDCLREMKQPNFNYSKMAEYTGSVYVKDYSFCLFGNQQCDKITNEYAKVCHRDLYDILEKLSGKKLLSDKDGLVTESGSSFPNFITVFIDYGLTLSRENYLWTADNFLRLKYILSVYKIGNGSQSLAFLTEFCADIPQQETLSPTTPLYVDYKELNSLMQTHQCIFDYSKAIGATIDKVKNTKWAGPAFYYISKFFTDVLNNIIIEFKTNWAYIVIGIAVTIVFSYLFMFFIKFMASVLIWLSLLVLLCACGLGGYVLIMMGQYLLKENDFRIENYGYSDQRVQAQGTALLTCGSIIAIVGIVLLLLLCCFFKSIRIAIAVLKVASDCFRRLFGIIILPLLFVPLIVAHLLWTVTGAFLFYTLGTFDVRYNSFDFKSIDYDDVLNEYVSTYQPDRLICFLLIIFMVIWGVFFFYAMIEYLVSSMVVNYYFAKDKKQHVLGFAIKCCIKSLGTLCVSSFITSFVVWVRFVFEYIVRRLNRSQQVKENRVIQASVRVARCCLKCLYKFVYYTNRNAQILAAISGEGYCKSCCQALIFEVTQFKHVFVLNTLGDFFLALSKVMAAVVTGVVVYLLVTYCNLGDKTMVVVPTFCSVVLGYIIAFYIFEIFELVVDSIFLSYVYENESMRKERENGVESFAPKALRDLLDGKYGGCCKAHKK